LLELIGSPAFGQPGLGEGPLELMASPNDQLPIDTGPLRKVSSLVAEKLAGDAPCRRDTGSAFAGASQLRQLHRDHCRGVGRRERQAHGAPGRHPRSIAEPMSNPERIQSQIEGAAINGADLAKYGEITFKDGRCSRAISTTFPVVRMDEAPLVTNVHIMPPGPIRAERRREPGVPRLQPALINADLSRRTGKRIRALPIGKQLEI